MAAKTAQTSSPTTLAALMKSIGTVVIIAFVFGIVIWWLAVVLNRLGSAPQVNLATGSVIRVGRGLRNKPSRRRAR